MEKLKSILKLSVFICVLCLSCSTNEEIVFNDPELPENIYRLAVVVHVIHNGQLIGEDQNLSAERIQRQIEILNEDFRRKEGTRGFNTDPNSADSKIEFVLAKRDPNGQIINGINRVDASIIEVDNLGYNQNHYAQYAYWDSEKYINIWLTPLPSQLDCLVLGLSSGPSTDLPGTEYLSIPQEGDAEGILINTSHFGETNTDCHANLGRTLTHEMGHYLGLLHPWGNGDCNTNDYCSDTPAVDVPVFGSNQFIGCEQEVVMISNYMNFSDDEVMNVFTKNQIERMHYVLNNHNGRNALLTSEALNN
ncbi:MAG: M43 family zinc metalloprotease [Bacteroidota bacterium]